MAFRYWNWLQSTGSLDREKVNTEPFNTRIRQIKWHFFLEKKSRPYEFSSVDISILPALETSPIICWIVSTYMAYSRVFPAQMWMFHFTGGDLFRHHDPLAHWPPWQMYQSTNYVVQESSTTKYSRQTAKTSLDCLRCFAFQKMLLKSDLCFLITSFTMLIVLGKDSFSSCSCTICQ